MTLSAENQKWITDKTYTVELTRGQLEFLIAATWNAKANTMILDDQDGAQKALYDSYKGGPS